MSIWKDSQPQLSTVSTHYKDSKCVTTTSSRRGQAGREAARAVQDVRSRTVPPCIIRRKNRNEDQLTPVRPQLLVDAPSSQRTPAPSGEEAVRLIQGAATLQAWGLATKEQYAAAHCLNRTWEYQKKRRVVLNGHWDPVMPGPVAGAGRLLEPGSEEIVS